MVTDTQKKHLTIKRFKNESEPCKVLSSPPLEAVEKMLGIICEDHRGVSPNHQGVASVSAEFQVYRGRDVP